MYVCAFLDTQHFGIFIQYIVTIENIKSHFIKQKKNMRVLSFLIKLFF